MISLFFLLICVMGIALIGAITSSYNPLGNSIESAEITNDSIVDADINSAAAIAKTKLASMGTAGKNVIFDVNGKPADGTNTDTEVADAVTKKHANTLDHSNLTPKIPLAFCTYAQGYGIGIASGAVVAVAHADADAIIAANGYVEVGGNFKLEIWHGSDAATRTDNGLIYLRYVNTAGAANSPPNLIDGEAIALVNTSAQYDYFTLSTSTVTIPSGSYVAATFAKNANDGANTLLIWGISLKRI